MDESIRTLLKGKKIPLRNLDPDDWVELINCLADELDGLARFMRLPTSIAEELRPLRRKAGATVKTKIWRGTSRLRFAPLGETESSIWGLCKIVLSEDGQLRCHRVVIEGFDTLLFESAARSGDFLGNLIEETGQYSDCGVYRLGWEIVLNLQELICTQAAIKAKHAKSFTDAKDTVDTLLSMFD